MTTAAKAKSFYDRHVNDDCFLMPNAWDAGSAKMLVASGFECIGTSSAGMAFAMGRADHNFCKTENRVLREQMLNGIQAITSAVSVPVNADLEAGFGDSPECVATTIEMAIKAGAVGGNIEDYTGNPAQPLYHTALAVERIQAARKAIDASGIPFVLVARTDGILVNQHSIAQAIERANLYREAGADCLFVPGVADVKTIATLVKEITGPINVVVGLSGSPSVAELRSVGVRRISIGGSLARAMYFHMREAAQEMREHGTFNKLQNQISPKDLNTLFEGKW